jgi:histidinol-phosphate aminotransferase
VAAALADLGAYPDETAAIAAVAERHGRSADEVVLLNGASQAFWLAAALGPRRPVCVHPSFTEPEVALRAGRRPPRRVVLDAPWKLPTSSSSATRPTRPASCTPAASSPPSAAPAA